MKKIWILLLTVLSGCACAADDVTALVGVPTSGTPNGTGGQATSGTAAGELIVPVTQSTLNSYSEMLKQQNAALETQNAKLEAQKTRIAFLEALAASAAKELEAKEGKSMAEQAMAHVEAVDANIKGALAQVRALQAQAATTTTSTASASAPAAVPGNPSSVPPAAPVLNTQTVIPPVADTPQALADKLVLQITEIVKLFVELAATFAAAKKLLCVHHDREDERAEAIVTAKKEGGGA